MVASPPIKLEILDAQAQAFHQAYAAAVDQLGHQQECPLSSELDLHGSQIAHQGLRYDSRMSV
jgi:hypothetical protein